MSKELIITNEDIELLKEMKDNCLKSTVYDDEKRLLKANALTKFLMLYQNWNELKKFTEENLKQYQKQLAQATTDLEDRINYTRCFCYRSSLDKMQELEGNNE